MIGLGTIINTAAIIVGGILGLFFGKLISETIHHALLKCNGIVVIFIGAAGVLSKMLTLNDDGTFETQKMLLFVLSLVLGNFIGELINLEGWIIKFGDWLQKKSKSTKDPNFTKAFIFASCTVAIGAMAIIGSIEDATMHNYSILFTKSIIDFVTILVMACTLGKGAIFSAIPVFIFQGLITLLAVVIAPILQENTLNAISMVGNALIFCVGLNLIRESQMHVANMLPSLLFAIAFSYIPFFN